MLLSSVNRNITYLYNKSLMLINVNRGLLKGETVYDSSFYHQHSALYLAHNRNSGNIFKHIKTGSSWALLQRRPGDLYVEKSKNIPKHKQWLSMWDYW